MKEKSLDTFVSRVDKRVQALKYNSGLEEYMLFGELLDEEREKGKAEGKSELIPRLADPDFLEAMLKQYSQD